MTLPWIEKYRPKKITDLVGQTDIIDVITNLASTNQLPHLLIHGKAGIGKTSAVLAIARNLYKEHINTMVLEMNASDNRGIDVVRNQIKNFASTANPFMDKPKLIILDEADQMTPVAQYALRKMIEEYTFNVRFCLICNYIDNIIPAIHSRCAVLRFKPLKKNDIIDRIKSILTAENVIFDDCIELLIDLTDGDFRKILNICQAIAYDNNTTLLTLGNTTLGNTTLGNTTLGNTTLGNTTLGNTTRGNINKESIIRQTKITDNIENVYNALLTKSYIENYNLITDLIYNQNRDIVLLLKQLTNQIILKNGPPIVDELANIENNIKNNCSLYIQIVLLISKFQTSKNYHKYN